jgi:tetratricopeptide (TPR) repeat protein
MCLETSEGLKPFLTSEPGGVLDTNVCRAILELNSGYIFSIANRNRAEEAVQLKLQNLAEYERYFGILDHDSMTALQDLAVIYELNGDLTRSQATYQEAKRRFEQTRRLDTYDGINVSYNLAWSHFLLGDLPGAESLLREALARSLRVYNPEYPLTLDIQHRLVRVLAEARRWSEAEDLAEKTLVGRRRVLGAGDGRTAYSEVVLARLLIQRGQLERAEPLLVDARTIFRGEDFAEQPRLAAAAENWLGALYLARKDYTRAAEQLLPLAEQFLHLTIQMSPEERRICIGHIISLYQATEKPEKVLEWQAKQGEIANLAAKSEQKD